MVIEEYQKEKIKVKIFDDAIVQDNEQWEQKLVEFLIECEN